MRPPGEKERIVEGKKKEGKVLRETRYAAIKTREKKGRGINQIGR